MVISWIFFVTIGILLSRYFKYLLPNKKFCGVEFWLFIHRIIMILATVCTLIAFCVVLVGLEGKWVPTKDKVKFTHSIFGLFTILFSIVQVIYLLPTLNH